MDRKVLGAVSANDSHGALQSGRHLNCAQVKGTLAVTSAPASLAKAASTRPHGDAGQA